MKIIAVSELEDSTFRESPKNAGVYLEISLLDCLTTKKFQDFSRTFQNFSKITGLSRIFQDFPLSPKYFFLWLTVIYSVLKSDCFKLCILLC